MSRHTARARSRDVPAPSPVTCAACAGRAAAELGGRALTCVGGELEGPAEVAVSRCRPGAHVEHVGGERVEALDVRVPGGRLHDAIAALVLVLPAHATPR